MGKYKKITTPLTLETGPQLAQYLERLYGKLLLITVTNLECRDVRSYFGKLHLIAPASNEVTEPLLELKFERRGEIETYSVPQIKMNGQAEYQAEHGALILCWYQPTGEAYGGGLSSMTLTLAPVSE